MATIEDALVAMATRVDELEAALRSIAGYPCEFQDDANAANMRCIARDGLAGQK